MLCKSDKRTPNFLRRNYFYFSLVCYILGAFLTKQLLHSRLLDMTLVIANSLTHKHLISSTRYWNNI